MGKKDISKLETIIWVIVGVVIIGSLLGVPTEWINVAVEWSVSLFVVTVMSIVAGSFVEAFTGDFLKKIMLNIPITDDLSISVSLFTITTFIAKYWLFRRF